MDKYWISRRRFNTLIEYIHHYPEWLEQRASLCMLPEYRGSGDGYSDRTGRIATKIAELNDKIHEIDELLNETDEALGRYILMWAVGIANYEKLKNQYGIPCSGEEFKEKCRKFLWLLHLAK